MSSYFTRCAAKLAVTELKPGRTFSAARMVMNPAKRVYLVLTHRKEPCQMRSQCKVAAALGAALITVPTILTSPAAANTNPCGAGYTLRESMPIDKIRITTIRAKPVKPVKPIGTLKTYSLGTAKCAFLSINPGWKRVPEITQVTVHLSWGSGVKRFHAYSWDWEGRTSPSIGPSVGPVKVTIKKGCAYAIPEVWLDTSTTTTVYGSRRFSSDCF
ncbi:hypothetical protein ABZ897_42850 [Nonomuraea sp. NPDC046802]|uniref:hypothetical protein n=1 Tax=Nonomuraea sp. NPDC046802 TaxID=3154919 RepID=UPI003404289F